MTQEEIGKLLASVAAIYPNTEISEPMMAIWPEVLSGISYPEAHAAVLKFMKSPSAFPPTPGQILEIVRSQKIAKQYQVDRDIKRIESTKQITYQGDARSTLSEAGLKKLLALTGK